MPEALVRQAPFLGKKVVNEVKEIHCIGPWV